ncbi:MAG: alkaline shock response membrane anchor protein AmaP [Clostridia bacterium]|nr:alkaline shock response membrane anchor protein AmaP [Clostridia bacterium]
MKFIDKLISFIFSLAILVLAITVILVLIGYVSTDRVYGIIGEYVFAENVKQISLITAIVVVLAVLKVTIFNSSFKSKDKGPILVETNRGMIEISQDTIDNTVRSVASEFPEVKEVQAKMVKKNKGIKIYAAISVLANTNIRALTAQLQERIEQVIDETTGIKTLSTNIKVKNIYEKNKKAVKSEVKVAPQAKVVEEKKEIQKAVEDVKEEVVAEVKEELAHEEVAKEENQEVSE